MQKMLYTAVGLAAAFAINGCASLGQDSLKLASKSVGAETLHGIEFSGTGRWYQFGQAPNPDLPWPPFTVKSYKTDIDYASVGSRTQISRIQVVETGRNRPQPTEQNVDQYLNGDVAWNVTPAPANQANASATVSAQPTAVEERSAEIWSSPHGFLKAALAHQAQSREIEGGSEVSFSLDGKHRFVGRLNDKHQLVKVQTWIDNPLLGDTLIETAYTDYRDFGGIQFPAHIVRQQGGFPVLDINVSQVKANPALDIAIPEDAKKKPSQAVAVNKLADGVFYLTGGTHHSVAIEQQDHIVLVEAPLHEERSLALIETLKSTIPGKPIKYLVNPHAHFDHSGGLRTFVDAGASIVTHQPNQAYYEKVWKNPHTINPDKLEKSQKAPHFESFTGKQVLTDGKRNIEIHSLAGNSHNDAFVLVYLPKEKILIEADAYTPLATNAPAPSSVNPYSVNLYETIQKLKLNVGQIAALHGPRVATLADLRNAIGLNRASN